MIFILRKLLISFILGACILLTGCFDKKEEDSKLPWTKPASWEKSGPGLGGFVPY